MGKEIKGQQLTRRTWIAGGLAVAMAPVITACGGGGGAELASSDEKLMPLATGPNASDFTGNYNYGSTGNTRQVLDLYRAASATVANPGPIYIWAHPNGTTYRGNVPSDSIRRQLRDLGVSIISWESYGSLTQANEPGVTADAYLMLQWVRSNAARLGLDANRIILGGSSRGTFASWKIGHDPAHASFIKGMFMKQALPGSVDSTKPVTQASPNTIAGQSPSYWVTASSPTIKFAHESPQSDLFHCHYNSDPVMTAYGARGIASRATQHTYVSDVSAMDGLYLVDFVTACLSASPPPPPPPSAINFSDDFNNGFNTANYATNGSWDVAAGALRQTSSSSYGYCAAGENAWANYTVTATLMSLNSLSATDNAQVSRVVARFIDGDNFYEAFVSKNGLLTIQSKKAGAIRTIQTVQVNGVDVTNWHTLSLSCNGNSLTASVNGLAQVAVQDTDHSAGKAGVRSFACETRVDSLSIVGV